jgi:uncharacterized protein (DUF697 family)
MRLGFMNRLRHGYGNIYTPHAGSMIIQVQRETGLANRTIVLTERQVALLRVLGSRVGVAIAAAFLATWLLFAVQSIRVPMLSGRIAELERDNRRIDSLQVALSRMHGRYEQVRQMLAAGGTAARATGEAPPARSAPPTPPVPNANQPTAPATSSMTPEPAIPVRDTAPAVVR